jgi:anti-sigma regulatory factor (Ser/Thr protein kinase)
VSEMRAIVDVPGTPSAVEMAVEVVSAILGGWGLSELAEDAQTVVRELVKNALQHAGGADSYELELVRKPYGVRLYLADGSAIRPVVAELNSDAPSGRGMRIVEKIAAGWGSDDHHGGKRVWVDLTTNGRPPFD